MKCPNCGEKKKVVFSKPKQKYYCFRCTYSFKIDKTVKVDTSHVNKNWEDSEKAVASEVEGKPRYGVALFIDFDSEAALKSYLENPIHRAAEAQSPALFSEVLISNYLY